MPGPKLADIITLASLRLRDGDMTVLADQHAVGMQSSAKSRAGEWNVSRRAAGRIIAAARSLHQR
jgi:hypothetical protein